MGDKTMTTNTVTREQLAAGMQLVRAVAEAVRECGRAPEGTLYAALMGRMDLQAFNSMVAMLVRTGLVRKEGHELIWSGPAKEQADG